LKNISARSRLLEDNILGFVQGTSAVATEVHFTALHLDKLSETLVISQKNYKDPEFEDVGRDHCR